MQNDPLINHIRTLAKAVANGGGESSSDLKQAAQYIEDMIGLDGPIVEKTQIIGDCSGSLKDSLNNNIVQQVSEDDETGDIGYLPHHGVVVVSQHRIYDWSRNASRKDIKYTGSDDQKMYAIPESQILSMANTIKQHQRLSKVTEALKEGKDLRGQVLHPDTDAEKSTHGDFYKYENWDNVEKSQSSITLSITSGSRYLNGSMAKHQHWVSINITSPDGRVVAEVDMSPDQFATFLISRGPVPCTLDHYNSIDENSVALRERVYNPESIINRMHQRLKDSTKEQDKDLKQIVENLKEKAGKPLSKKDLDTLINQLERSSVGRVGTSAFIIEQAMEEGSALAESTMIRVALAQQTGNVKEAIEGIVHSFKAGLLEHKKYTE